jgi:hypothetical protein
MLPNTWDNPDDIKDRKCTMSCSICHVDPAGGGLRNTSGRFYGQTTLPGFLASRRGYKDTTRFLVPQLSGWETPQEEINKYNQAWNLLEEIRLDAIQKKDSAQKASQQLEQTQQSLKLAVARTEETAATLAQIKAEYPGSLPEDTSALDPEQQKLYEAWIQKQKTAQQEDDTARSEAASLAEALRQQEEAQRAQQQAYEDAKLRYKEQRESFLTAKDDLDDARDWLYAPAWGNPLGKGSKMDFVQGRYGSLNADPLVAAGLDLRFASWTADSETQLFPMQLDAQVAIQPIQHVTLYTNVGALSKVQGFDPEAAHPIAAKEAFVMYHELPYNAYVKAGRFLPQFGIRQEDHTAPNRRDFELDHGILESRGFGVEAGINANYPYASVSLFRPGPRDEFFRSDNEVPTFGVDGLGTSFNVGYRQLGWQLGGSFMMKNRDIINGGDTRAINAQWGFNPWFYNDRLPFTYLGEYSIGTLERPISGSKAAQMASFHELNYAPFNGINFKGRVDLSDPDLQVRDDHQLRYSLIGELTMVAGVKLIATARIAQLPADITIYGRDLFLQLRLWL